MKIALAGNAERQLGGVDFLLHRAAEIYPTRLAIDDRLNGVRLTYDELRRRAIQLARGLESLGVRKGDVVASAFRNEAMAIEVVFACAMLGAISAPLNARLAPIEARSFLRSQSAFVLIANEAFRIFAEDSGVTHVVLHPGGRVSRVTETGVDYENLIAGQPTEAFAPRASWNDPYMIGMTGGTTGGSKGAVWSHVGVLLDMLSIINHWSIEGGFRALCSAPIYHAAGLGWACMPVLWQAGTLVFPGSVSFDPKQFLNTLVGDEIDCCFLVPGMVSPLYREWNRVPMAKVKSIALASAPVPKALRVKVAEMFPSAKKLVCYGMTECYSISMQHPEDFLDHGEGVGEPALVARIRIVDDHGVDVPRGTAGHVLARTLGQCLYYNNDPKNTVSAFRTCVDDPEGLEWVNTGDVGYLDAQGRLTLLDRAKDIIISGGENVASSEVESVLMLHPEIAECAVIGLANEKWGEMVCAVVVCASANEQHGRIAAELHCLCREQLAGFKTPKRFVFADALPRNTFGKVLKRELRTQGFEISFDSESLRLMQVAGLTPNAA